MIDRTQLRWTSCNPQFFIIWIDGEVKLDIFDANELIDLMFLSGHRVRITGASFIDQALDFFQARNKAKIFRIDESEKFIEFARDCGAQNKAENLVESMAVIQ